MMEQSSKCKRYQLLLFGVVQLFFGKNLEVQPRKARFQNVQNSVKVLLKTRHVVVCVRRGFNTHYKRYTNKFLGLTQSAPFMQRHLFSFSEEHILQFSWKLLSFQQFSSMDTSQHESI